MAPKAIAPADRDLRDPRAVPDDIRGWYCYEIRRKPKDKDVLSRCRRLKETCEASRDSIVEMKLKAHITPCEYRDKASCFYIEDTVEKEMYLWCYTDYIQCLGGWADNKDKKEPHIRIHRCQEDIE